MCVSISIKYNRFFFLFIFVKIGQTKSKFHMIIYIVVSFPWQAMVFKQLFLFFFVYTNTHRLIQRQLIALNMRVDH